MRRLPRSFFWIDQQLIRSGGWSRLCANSRLLYVAVAASCDREGLSIYSRSKLMELSALGDSDEFDRCLEELENQKLIEKRANHVPPAISIASLDPISTSSTSPSQSDGTSVGGFKPQPQSVQNTLGGTTVVIHTHTTFQIGNRPTNEESSAC